MNLEELKKTNYTIFQCISGSHSYGLARPDSDVDERGIFILPMSNRLSIMDFDQEVSDDKQDKKYFEIRKFFKLAVDCNPALIEMMWMPEDCVKFKDERMQKIIDNRSLFISQKAYFTHSGYSHAQIMKATGRHKLINNPKPKEPPKKEDFCWFIPDSKQGVFLENMHRTLFDKKRNMPFRPIVLDDWNMRLRASMIDSIDLSQYHAAALEHVPNTFRLYYYGKEAKGIFRGDDMLVCESIPMEDEWDKFAGILVYNQHEFEKAHKEWKQYHDWVKERNSARWLDQENKVVQFDTKNMLHSFRLLYSGINILTHGEPMVRFEGETREFLMDIRRNKFTYEFLMGKVEKEMAILEDLKKTTKLPYGANVAKINELYLSLVMD